MKVKTAVFCFSNYTFEFKNPEDITHSGRKYKKWTIEITYKGCKYETHYIAFAPSAHICRVVKRSKNFLKNKIY